MNSIDGETAASNMVSGSTGSTLLLSSAAFCQQPSVSKVIGKWQRQVVGKWQRILSPGSGGSLTFGISRKEKGNKSQVVWINCSGIKYIFVYLEFSNCVAHKKAHAILCL